MRELGDGYNSPYFEDYDLAGDSYSLAWRYLGVYIDDDGYSRKVLWAAYYDPGYSYDQIGGYSFFDWTNQKWDNSTCKSSSCIKMNCHDTSSSNWELVGVYKSSLGFDNDSFYEQLFKHQGYCLWTTSSDYTFMQSMREEMETCKQITSSVYIGIKPMEGGNMTQAVYTDNLCTTESSSDYSVDNYLSSSWGSLDKIFDKWNTLMDAYKTCQPCRAYSRTSNYQRRHLIEYNDGYGAEEQNGYNCYDDAHYRNCNQCYKFDTHAGMEEASDTDLQLASDTILGITVAGVYYGYRPDSYYSYYAYASSVGVVAVAVAVAARFAGFRCKRRIIVSGDQPLDQPVLEAQKE